MLVLLSLVSTIFSIKLVSKRNEIVDKKQKLVGLQNDIKKLDQIVIDKTTEQANIDRVLSSLPQTYEEVGTLAYKVEDVARQNNLKPELGFDKEIKLDANIPALSFQVISEGNFQNFINFLSSLNSLPYNSSVESIVSENKNGVTSTTTVKVYTKQ